MDFGFYKYLRFLIGFVLLLYFSAQLVAKESQEIRILVDDDYPPTVMLKMAK
jgi:hypothetical protein